MKLLLRPNGNKRTMKHLLSILIFSSYISLASADECSLNISYYPYGDGGDIWELKDKRIVKGTLAKHSTIHPTRGEIIQRGIVLEKPICIYDEINKTIFKSEYFNDEDYTDFIIPAFYDDEVCKGKIKEIYQDDLDVTISISEIWRGGNANYATAFAFIIDNIQLDDELWVCKIK
jgi:hypothetical protein